MAVIKEIKVEGMKCVMCKKHVEEALKSIESVKKVKVNLETGTVEIKSKEAVSNEEITTKIEELGFNVVF